MPAYNASYFIEDSIKSILNQSFTEWNLIILNDCSTDDTLEIINRYVSLDPRITCFENEKNLGIAKTRNKLLSLAKNRYIAWLDSDDIATQFRLEKQVRFLEENPKIFGIGSSRILIDDYNNQIGKLKCNFLDRNFAHIKASIIRENKFCNSSMMFRNEGFRIDESFPPAEDFEFWSRLILTENKKIVNQKDFLVQYRIHSNNSSNQNQIKQLELNKRIIFRNFKDCGIYYSAKNLIHFYGFLNNTQIIKNPIKWILINLWYLGRIAYRNKLPFFFVYYSIRDTTIILKNYIRGNKSI